MQAAAACVPKVPLIMKKTTDPLVQTVAEKKLHYLFKCSSMIFSRSAFQFPPSMRGLDSITAPKSESVAYMVLDGSGKNIPLAGNIPLKAVTLWPVIC